MTAPKKIGDELRFMHTSLLYVTTKEEKWIEERDDIEGLVLANVSPAERELLLKGTAEIKMLKNGDHLSFICPACRCALPFTTVPKALGAFCVALRCHLDLDTWSLSLVWCCVNETCRKIGTARVMDQMKKVTLALHGDTSNVPEKRTVCMACGKIQESLAVKFKQCGRCRIARYCSPECQKNAWTSHKSMCFVAKD